MTDCFFLCVFSYPLYYNSIFIYSLLVCNLILFFSENEKYVSSRQIFETCSLTMATLLTKIVITTIVFYTSASQGVNINRNLHTPTSSRKSTATSIPSSFDDIHNENTMMQMKLPDSKKSTKDGKYTFSKSPRSLAPEQSNNPLQSPDITPRPSNSNPGTDSLLEILIQANDDMENHVSYASNGNQSQRVSHLVIDSKSTPFAGLMTSVVCYACSGCIMILIIGILAVINNYVIQFM